MFIQAQNSQPSSNKQVEEYIDQDFVLDFHTRGATAINWMKLYVLNKTEKQKEQADLYSKEVFTEFETELIYDAFETLK